MKTAESVATKVANRISQNSTGGNGSQPVYITVPVNLDGQEIARVSAPYMSEELAFSASRGW
jgi:phage-related protein